MKTVQIRGSSFAISIPKAFADEMGLKLNDEVEISLSDGQIIVTPKYAATYSFHELLKGVTPENRPDEWDMGPAFGDEVW